MRPEPIAIAPSPLRSHADGLEVAAINRRRELFPWLAFRFFHIRVLYNWAWDPDRFDFGPSTAHYRIRQSGPVKMLVGGYRLIAPIRSLDEAMTPALGFFRGMVPRTESWTVLERNHDLVLEVSRFALAFFRMRDRKFVRDMVRVTLRAIYWEQARLGRPFCLAVVNPFLLSRYRKMNLAVKVLGRRELPARSVFERRIFGAVVPHFVVLLNNAISEQRCRAGELADGMGPEFVFDGMSAVAPPFDAAGEEAKHRVQAIWDAIEEDAPSA